MGADGSPAAESAPWRDAVAQVFVADLDSPEPDGDDLHHLLGVLRLRDGERVCATDGRGAWRMCVVSGDGLEPVSELDVQDAPSPSLTVGFAPVKGDRPQWVVQKLTEVGIDSIVVLFTERSVVRWSGERLDKQLERLRTVARHAAAQSRRLHVPTVQAATAAGVAAGSGGRGVLADAGGRALREDDHCILVGAEGGWTDAERAGRDLVGLGDAILRAETAAVVAGAAMSSLRLGLSRPGLPSFSP